MALYVGLVVSQKTAATCIVDHGGQRIWRGECRTLPDEIAAVIRRHAGDNAQIGIDAGSMTPWLVHEMRGRKLSVVCLDARHARAALKMQISKTDRNDAERLAQIMRTGWYRAVHAKSFEAHRARTLLAARLQLIETTTWFSNYIRGALRTFCFLPCTVRGLRFDARVELLLEQP